MMKTCDYCGRDSGDSLAQCRECGTSFSVPEPEAPAKSDPVVAALAASFNSFLTAFPPQTRRMIAPCFAAVVFCLWGSPMGGPSSRQYELLAWVFALVPFVWCNAAPYRFIRVVEWLGWLLLFLLWVAGMGSF